MQQHSFFDVAPKESMFRFGPRTTNGNYKKKNYIHPNLTAGRLINVQIVYSERPDGQQIRGDNQERMAKGQQTDSKQILIYLVNRKIDISLSFHKFYQLWTAYKKHIHPMILTHNYEESFFPRIAKGQQTDGKRIAIRCQKEKSSNLSSATFVIQFFCYPFWVFTTDNQLSFTSDKARFGNI